MSEEEFNILLNDSVKFCAKKCFNEDEQVKFIKLFNTSNKSLPSLLNFKSDNNKKLDIYIDESNEDNIDITSATEDVKREYENYKKEIELETNINLVDPYNEILKSDQIKSNQIKSDQIKKSNQIKSNQIKSDENKKKQKNQNIHKNLIILGKNKSFITEQ